MELLRLRSSGCILWTIHGRSDFCLWINQNLLSLERMSLKERREIPNLIGHTGRDWQVLPGKSKKDKRTKKQGVQKNPQTTYLVSSNITVFTLGSVGVLSQKQKRNLLELFLMLSTLPFPSLFSHTVIHGFKTTKKLSKGCKVIVTIYFLLTETKDYGLASKGSIFFGFISTPIWTIGFPNNISLSCRPWVMLESNEWLLNTWQCFIFSLDCRHCSHEGLLQISSFWACLSPLTPDRYHILCVYSHSEKLCATP